MMAVAPCRSARLELHAALAELSRLAPWVDEVAAEMRLASETTFALHLCLDEAVANIVRHGGGSHDAAITVVLEPPDGHGVIAVIEDTARPFDPTSMPAWVAPQTIAEASKGKLGLHLIRNYAAGIEYERRGDRNRLTLRFGNQEGRGE